MPRVFQLPANFLFGCDALFELLSEAEARRLPRLVGDPATDRPYVELGNLVRSCRENPTGETGYCGNDDQMAPHRIEGSPRRPSNTMRIEHGGSPVRTSQTSLRSRAISVSFQDESESLHSFKVPAVSWVDSRSLWGWHIEERQRPSCQRININRGPSRLVDLSQIRLNTCDQAVSAIGSRPSAMRPVNRCWRFAESG